MDLSRYFHDLAREAATDARSAENIKFLTGKVGDDAVDVVRYALQVAARLQYEMLDRNSRIIVVPEQGYGDPKDFEVYP